MTSQGISKHYTAVTWTEIRKDVTFLRFDFWVRSRKENCLLTWHVLTMNTNTVGSISLMYMDIFETNIQINVVKDWQKKRELTLSNTLFNTIYHQWDFFFTLHKTSFLSSKAVACMQPWVTSKHHSHLKNSSPVTEHYHWACTSLSSS